MRWLVISYDDDQQQTFYDRVIAPSEDEAKVIIGGIRDYAIPVCALSVGELLKMGRSLRLLTEATIKTEMEDLQKTRKEETEFPS